MAVKCDIVSSEVVQGRTAYTISVEREGGRQSLLRRHYTDFLALDQEEPVKCLAPESKPMLPPKGRLGLRHRLNLGSFNAQRLDGLRQYLTQLLQTEAGASDAVEKFLAAAPLETAPTSSVAAPLALEKFLEDAVPTGSTATPRSDESEDATVLLQPSRSYRLMPSTGTWLLRLPGRQPAASGSSAATEAAAAEDAQAADADAAALADAAPAMAAAQVDAEAPADAEADAAVPAPAAALVPADKEDAAVPVDAASGDAEPAEASAPADAAPAEAAADAAAADAEVVAAAAPADEAADASGDAAVPAEVAAQAAVPADAAADAAPAHAPAAAATAKASAKQQAPRPSEPAQAAAKSKSARRRARNKARASGREFQ